MKTFILSVLEGAGTPQDRRNRAEKNTHIEPEGPLLDVLAVEEDDVLEIQNLTATADLPESRDSRLRVETAEVMVFVFLKVRFEERPRSDQRHVANQNVGKLRQLVEAPAPQELPQSSGARVVRDLEQPTIAGVIEMSRSEERRVGKECRSRWATYQ